MPLISQLLDWGYAVFARNVFGMSQHADGGLITTKPYLSTCEWPNRSWRSCTGIRDGTTR